MKNKVEDIELVEKILSGDKNACGELIDRYKNYAFTISLRILNNRENAEEVSQDAFIQMLNGLKSFNKEAKFSTWFYRIVFNAALGYKRKNKIIHEDIESAHYVHEESMGASAGIKKQEQQYYIQQALKSLSAEDATLIILFYMKELSMEEIAEITGITANNAKVKLHRARQKLATELNKLLQGEAKNLL